MDDISANITAVRSRIAAAAAACGRDPADIALLGVTKAQPSAAVAAAWAAGVQRFGINYVVEADAHVGAAPEAEWHYIGRIQSNKTRAIATRFSWVQTVDRARTARRLAAQRPPGMPPLQVCIQLNLDGEASKAGVDEAAAGELATVIDALPALRLRGVMAIPRPRGDDASGQRAAFAAVRSVYERLQTAHPALDTLSMGMSGDLEAAVAEGATLVRIGTALFGARA